MKRTVSYVVSSFLVIGAALSSVACTSTVASGGSSGVACKADSDCRGDDVCRSGTCVDGDGPSPSPSPSPTPAQKLRGTSWAMNGQTSCKSGALLTQRVYSLCPNGRVLGGGEYMISGGKVIELQCGSYSVKDAQYSSCNDKLGCFPSVEMSVRSTIKAGTEKDVESIKQTFFYVEKDGVLVSGVKCKDESSGLMYLTPVEGSTTDDDCVVQTPGLCP